MKLIKGFTLIELMVTITIIVVLSGGSIVAFLNFNKSQSIDNDARILSAEIYRVRTLASSMQYPTGCTSLKGYSVVSDNNLTGLVTTANCDPVDVVFPAVKLLAGSVFTQAVNLTFSPGSGYLGNGSDQQIVIQYNLDNTVTKTINIGAYGTVTAN